MKITDQQWLKNSDLIHLMGLLNRQADTARIVGGAVRDALMKKAKIGDIDIASKLKPLENTALLEREGIKVIPTGIKYGTVTAILNAKPYEITTLRRDVTTDGRWADVEYTGDWAEDAARRDFTINALYLNIEGVVYDPLGGFADIEARRVRFIGDAKQRISEDALRILRFFRFSSQFGACDIDQNGLEACIELKHMINGLSGERIWQELSKILDSNQVEKIIPVMAKHQILSEIIKTDQSLDEFLQFTEIEKKLELCDIIGRLSCLVPRDQSSVKKVAEHLKLSNIQAKTLNRYGEECPDFLREKIELRKLLYRYGKEVIIHNLCRDAHLTDDVLSYINSYQIPAFPIAGKDMIKKGWKEGREMGAELKRLEDIWIESDFKTLEN